MSELRKVKFKIKEELAIEVAEKLGYEVERNKIIDSYATRHIKGDIVFKKRYIEFGIVDGELIYDNMYSSNVADFVSEYMSAVLQRKGLNPIVQREKNKIHIYVNP